MMRRVLICATAVIFMCCFGSVAFAADPGPANMVLQSEGAKKPKPAVFPHKAHQDMAKCGDCHHSAKDGKQVPYEDGQEIATCESCHNEGSGMPKKLDSAKDAAHANCKTCHKKAAEENPDLKDKFKGCMPCHPKDIG